MEFIVPDSVKRVLGEFEARQQGFRELDLFQAIANLAKPPTTLSDAERRGVWIETTAFEFMEPEKTPREPWNSVFAPMATMRTQNGEDRYFPDIKSADESVIFHWGERSRETTNPVMCARYADLVWEFGPLVTQTKRDVEFARRSIDAYLRAVRPSIMWTTFMHLPSLDARCLFLSPSTIRDSSREVRMLLSNSIAALAPLHEGACGGSYSTPFTMNTQWPNRY
jgi:hypothetical protein